MNGGWDYCWVIYRVSPIQGDAGFLPQYFVKTYTVHVLPDCAMCLKQIKERLIRLSLACDVDQGGFKED